MKQTTKSLIFTVLSILGLGTTTVLAVRSGMKTKKILDENPNAKKPSEIIGITWKAYIATVISMIATGTCIVTSHSLDVKQIAALSGVVATGATTFSKYRSKVSEVVGPEEEKKIFNAVCSDSNLTVYPAVIDLGEYPNDTLFLDTLSGRYFYSSLPRVFHAIYHLNRNLSSNLVVYADEWYDFLAIDKEVTLSDSAWYYEVLTSWGMYPWVDVVISDEVRADGTPYKMISFDESPLSPEELKEADEYLYNDLIG